LFVDTNVLLYAAGTAHALKRPAESWLRRIASGEVAATTSSEVVQEILFVLARRDAVDEALALTRDTLVLFPNLLAVGHKEMSRSLALLRKHPATSVRDAVHAGTMLENGVRDILTADRDFARIPGIRVQALAR
jgi:predicted nucleic acid-binding protein